MVAADLAEHGGRGSKPDTSPDLMAVFVTPVSTDPDAVAYQYHSNSWGMYYGSSFYENADVWGLIERARTLGRLGGAGADLRARSRSASSPTCPRSSA